MTTHTPQQWGVLFAVAATQFAVPFMISSVGVALPVIGLEFHASGVALSLVESVFLGVNAMSLLCFGRASDLMGRNWIFTTGLSIFILATIALGFVQSIHALIAIRAVQALGGAMQLSTGLAILLRVFSLEERGRVLGITIACVYLGLSAGPFIGGHIAGAIGWRWLFFTCVFPCLVALGLSFRALPWDFHRSEIPFDFAGTLLSMVCIGLLLYAGANVDSPYGLLSFGGFVVTLLLFLRLESRSANPLLDIKLFTKSLDFSFGNLLQFINYAATFGLTFLMSLYLQLGHGMSPVTAGTILVIQPLTQSVLSPFCGRLSDSYSSEVLSTIGMALSVAGLGWASTFSPSTSMVSIFGMLALMGVGIAFFASPNMKLIMRPVAPENYGVATAVTGQMRIVGMTMSMVAISMAISFIVGDKVLNAESFGAFNRVMSIILLGGCVLSGLGMVLSVVIPLRGKRAKRSEA